MRTATVESSGGGARIGEQPAVPGGAGFSTHPDDGSQEAMTHGSLDVHVGGGPATHSPAEQTLWPLHAFMSESQAVPSATGVSTQPLSGSHDAVKHGLSVAHAGGAFGVHAPAPSHVGADAHWFAAAPHGVPSGAGVTTQPVAGSQAATAHALSVAHDSGVPGWQAPTASHVEIPVQTSSPEPHAVPAAIGVVVQPVAGSHAAARQGPGEVQTTGSPEMQVPCPSQ